MSKHKALSDRIHELYRTYVSPNDICISPYIGSRFEAGEERDLRIMAHGINAYWNWDKEKEVSEELPKPEYFRNWYETETHKGEFKMNGFMKRIKPEIAKIGTYLVTEKSSPFYDYKYSRAGNAIENHYLTDVIKRYTSYKEGKCARDLDPKLVEDHSKIFASELRVLAEHECLPHVIILFWSTGATAWNAMWKAFHPEYAGSCDHPAKTGVTTIKYIVGKNGLEQYANHIVVEVNGGTQSVLLLRLNHPSRYGIRKAKWFTETKEDALKQLFA